MSVEIAHPGLLTTIQDAGRTGYQQYGFSPGGALDKRAMATANLLAGNPRGEAVLEMTLLGAQLTFHEDNIIAITGGGCEPRRNEGEPVPTYRAVLMHAGDTLDLGAVGDGCRVYVAFAGGLQVPESMGSKSTQVKYGLGGLDGKALKRGDVIPFAAPRTDLPHFADRVLPAPGRAFGAQTLRVVMGPQADAFTKEGLETFLSQEYEVTNESDRMGCRLNGPALGFSTGADIVSDATALGSIQVPASGKPIILLCDRQTVGGYAKIATVISSDIPVIAQCRMGDWVRFEAVSVKAAQRLYHWEQKQYRAWERKWNKE